MLPGVLGVGVLGGYGVWARRQRGFRAGRSPGASAGRAVGGQMGSCPLPFVVLGGIYSGMLVVSEAAVITAAYVLIVEVLVYREIRVRKLAGIIRDTMVLVGGVLLILGMGMAITNYLIDQEVPMLILDGARRTSTARSCS